MSDPEKFEGIVLIPGPTRNCLNERQIIAYKSHRESYITWLKDEGVDPEKQKGYSHATAHNYAGITDKFHRWAWVNRGGYTLDLTHEQADAYLDEQISSDEDYSSSHLHNVQLTLKAYFRFRDDVDDWESDANISSPAGASQPKDYVTMDERKALREASLEFGTVPAYAALSPEKRSEWKRFLARRFGKPINEVSQDDWKRANGFKYPSIVHTSLDAGLRPIEVGRAKTYWVDIENARLQIPKEESSKNKQNWTVSLRRETAEYLAQWMKERKMYDKYNDTDQLWLTRHGNSYSSSSLTYLIDSLCDIAEIDRDITWYAIRHSTGTYMAREEDLAAAQSQLRHKRTETTMKYDQAPVEDRRDALDRMG